ncbi:hypothetical protein RUE5091_04408 [Ruegeria denitrificans]|uniref:EamA-like transporter family protein n=1 Tax=Ruegeria denitrificans TaxID=1715692 RepID=A0A0N7MB03_9RHOB|nr:hypothetical protein [Ruegeria denitrificans]CUK19632.1 hypothetical protein RUE5091_04408 [Ruegeria denitrificans]
MTSTTLLHSLILVVSAMILIVIGNAAGKALTAGGVNPFFVAWVRFSLGALVLLPLLRALLLTVGFGGVLLVVKPGFGMSPGLLFFFFAECAHECYLTTTRWLSED